MEFSTFLSKISKKNTSNSIFNGAEAQFKMIPKGRKHFDITPIKNAKLAGVLALCYPNELNETMILLTLRASYNGTHSSEISFPGGKKDAKDSSLKETALRETYEEVGVIIKDITIIKTLTKTYIPPSNFLVSSFVGFCKKRPIFKKNHEVETIIEIKLATLLNNNNKTLKNISTSAIKNIEVPCFKLNGYTVWGATAMILNELKELLNHN